MRSVLVLALLALVTSQVDLQAQPIPVLKCLLGSEILKKDVIVVIDAIKQFNEDKNVLLLVSKLMAVYPEMEKEVKRCLEEEGMESQDALTKLM